MAYTTAGSNTTRFGFGCKYQLDDDSAVRAKINNASQLGLSYQQKLRQGIVIDQNMEFQFIYVFLATVLLSGVTLTLSSLVDLKNFNQGGQKIGMALELEA